MTASLRSVREIRSGAVSKSEIIGDEVDK